MRWSIAAAVAGYGSIAVRGRRRRRPLVRPGSGRRLDAGRRALIPPPARRVDHHPALRAGATEASRVRTKLDGKWGIPAVTSTGVAGGLAPDGRTLVLSEPPSYSGLRSKSTFLVLSTDTLAIKSTIVLNGEFGFDAIAPDGRTLYLIQHRSRSDLVSYVVRGYDLRHGRLLRGVIVAKGENGSMRGYPVSRATSKESAWVYTLYSRGSGTPFIHALNTNQRFAVCIDLPWEPGSSNIWLTRLEASSRRPTIGGALGRRRGRDRRYEDVPRALTAPARNRPLQWGDGGAGRRTRSAVPRPCHDSRHRRSLGRLDRTVSRALNGRPTSRRARGRRSCGSRGSRGSVRGVNRAWPTRPEIRSC